MPVKMFKTFEEAEQHHRYPSNAAFFKKVANLFRTAALLLPSRSKNAGCMPSVMMV